MGLTGSWQGGGLNAVMGGGGLEFQQSRERGGWGSRLSHLPATCEGELERRTESFFAEVRLLRDTGDSTPKVYLYI